MNIKKLSLVFFVLLTIIGNNSFSQTRYPIDSLFNKVEENYPSIRQQILNIKDGELVQKGLDTNWYPKVNIAGSATYQNEVTEFSIPGNRIGGFPTTKKDQYKLGLEITQQLFDAGLTKVHKEIEELNTINKENSLNAEILKVKEAVLDAAITIMVAKNTLKQLSHTMDNLNNRLKILQVSIDNDEALPSKKDELEVEILQLDQQVTGIKTSIKTAYETLQTLSGLNMDKQLDIEFSGMEAQRTRDFELRPEVQNFDIAQLKLDWQKLELKRQALPKISLFADGYYGRPGFNFLDNNFRPYGIGGINLSFPISSLAYNKTVKKELKIQKEYVELDKKKLIDQLSIQNNTLKNNMAAIKSYIQEDAQIVTKRHNILEVAQTQFDNGVLLSTDYLEKLYNAQNAEINLSIHKLQLQQLMIKQKLLFNE